MASSRSWLHTQNTHTTHNKYVYRILRTSLYSSSLYSSSLFSSSLYSRSLYSRSLYCSSLYSRSNNSLSSCKRICLTSSRGSLPHTHTEHTQPHHI
jgi:hypothetical protein